METPVLITQDEYDKAEAVFAAARDLDCRPAPAGEAALAALVRETGCRCVVLGVAPYRDALYDALAANAGAHGALLIRFGFGTDSIDKAQARKKGLLLVNTPVDIQTSVAELTVFLIGALLRHVPRLDATVRGGGFAAIRGRELCGKTALIVGGGKIGLKVAKMLHHGFGVRVLACSQSAEPEWLGKAGLTRETMRDACGIEAYSPALETLLPQAEIVCLHLPLTVKTKGLIGARQFALMRLGSVLVNMGRGGIVDEAALYDALASGHLAGAASDVFAAEPYAPASPGKDLRTLANTVLTPHCGSNTQEANARMAASAVAQASAFLAGRRDGLCLVPLTP